ncbi:MAG: outer membrane beta-barrel protein [Neisseria sp.]|nr:outer membrane beta-barrel protein [Neisseria sp.]
MKTIKLVSAAAIIGAAFASFNAHAGMVTDAHGNVGYDTAAECDAAVHAGTAKFYQSFTHKKPLIRKGEKSVQTVALRDLGSAYQYGACDIGVGHKLGRDGVSKALQGKYVPYSPDMPVNLYSDATGKAVRATMKQCDNWFSDNAPRPVAAPVRREPVAVVPAVVAPVVAAIAPKGLQPYAFGTIGALNDNVDSIGSTEYVNTKDASTRLAGQIGAGVQFNELLGAEAFYQGSRMHKYWAENEIDSDKVRNHTAGIRGTIGAEVLPNTRVFGKVGLAAVHHADSEQYGDHKTRANATAGLGATYNVTKNIAVRADYDHYFQLKNKNNSWKDSDYLGIGAQYNF